VKLVPAMTEGDTAAANWVASVPLGGDAEISRPTQRAIPKAAANQSERPGAGHAETAPVGPTLPTAGEGASVNACADQMLDITERLLSLAGYDIREMTTADSDETTLNGTLQLQAAIDACVWRAAAERSIDGL
jgi:hypothetical protein